MNSTDQHHTPLCEVLDFGLFIGFCTAPIGREIEFADRALKHGLFAAYREAVSKNFSLNELETSDSSIKEFNELLYRPQTYFTFGRFDLAVLSLIDDFEFGIRTFGPFDPMFKRDLENEQDLLGFSHQVVLGPIPKMSNDLSACKAVDFFCPSAVDDKLPLIAICQLKLNAGAFLGGGLNLIHFALRDINNRFASFRHRHPNISLFLAESYSWHELTLIVKGSSYNDIADFLLQVRETRFCDLREYLDEVEFTDEGEDRDSVVFDFMNRSRLTSVAIARVPSLKDRDTEEAHIYESSATTFGFRLEFFESNDTGDFEGITELVDRIDKEDKIVPICRWFTKAGHIQNTRRYLTAFDDTRTLACVGKGDIIYPFPEQMLSSYFISRYVKTRNDIHGRNDVVSSYTTIAHLMPDELNDYDEERHLLLRSQIALRLLIPLDTICEVDNYLTRCGLPKTVSERIENMFSNYNDGISDPSLFGYFIELMPVMTWVHKRIERWANESDPEGDVELLSNALTKIVDAFEIAYKNRFYSGYRMSEITDFNLEFKGAFHQPTSAFDAAFKAIIGALNPSVQKDHVFSVVSGTPWVATDENTLFLNYIHVCQPEFFASIIGHEAGFYDLVHGVDSDLEMPDDTELKKFRYNYARQPSDQILDTLQLLTIPELFSYVATDLTAFYLSYFGNSELFVFWYWAHWYTLPNSHSRKGTINEFAFVAMLVRVLSVLIITGSDTNGYLPPRSASRVFNDLATKWYSPTVEYVSSIWKERAFERWSKRALGTAIAKMRHAVGYRKEEFETAQCCRELEEMAQKYQMVLERGHPIHYSPTTEGVDLSNPSKHSLLLLHGYMNWITKRCNRRNPFLERHTKSGKVRISPDDSPILFDSRGGTFTHSAKIRRLYFRFRAALILSFLDMSAVEKRNWIVSHLLERDDIEDLR